MSKKYIIEIEDKPLVQQSNTDDDNALYRAVGFRSLVFDKYGLDNLMPLEACKPAWYDAAYHNGLKDAWAAARRIVLDPDFGGLSILALTSIFGERSSVSKVFMEHSEPQEVIEKLKAYDAKHENSKLDKKVEVGDEVIWDDCVKGVVMDVDTEVISIVTENGCVEGCGLDKVEKTGWHYDEVSKLLSKLREGMNNE